MSHTGIYYGRCLMYYIGLGLQTNVDGHGTNTMGLLQGGRLV